jgi:hypothetical protein
LSKFISWILVSRGDHQFCTATYLISGSNRTALFAPYPAQLLIGIFYHISSCNYLFRRDEMKSVSITSVRLLKLTVVIVALLLWLGNFYRVEGAPPEPVLQPTATSQPSGDESDVEPEISHQLFLSSPALPGVAPIQNAAPAITNNPVQLLATVGHWAGTTSQARPMSFDVLASGNQWDNFRVQATFNNCNVIVTYTLFGPGSINNNQFSGVSTDGVFSFSGQFNSASTASGVFNFFNISIPGCGNRSQSGTWTATIDSPAQIPIPPSNLTALALSQMQILLTWNDNSNNESGFKIEQSPTSIGPWTQIAIAPANVTSHAPPNLICGTTYYYQVRAYNGVGNSAYSNIANATTAPCPGLKFYLPTIMKNFAPPTPPPPNSKPLDGHWTGTTSLSQPMSFDVSAGGTLLNNFKLKTNFQVGPCSGTTEITISSPRIITNNQFSSSGSFSFSGQFNTPTSASGTYAYVNHFIPGCGNFNQSGTWTANVP